MNLFSLFRRKPAEAVSAIPDVDPAPGQVWRMKNTDGSPWPHEGSNAVFARVLDVRAGWVRYYRSEIFPDERRPLAHFKEVFECVGSVK